MKKLVFGILFISCLCSCGPVVKVTVKGTSDGVTTNITQTRRDSTALNLSVNPNVTINQ